MFKPAKILASLLIFLVGCSTTVRQVGNIGPTDWGAPGEVKPPPAVPVVPPVPAPVPPPAPRPPPPPEEPPNTWYSLERWSQPRGLGAPRRLSVAPVVTYALSTTNGRLVVTIGSRAASWDGLELRLGFAPQQIDGQVFLHGLDLRKNLEPLLAGFHSISGTNRVVVLDPGHGGNNLGTASVLDGRLEKEFTLDWARRLAPLLETNGWKVFLTRTSDVTVSNSDRVVFAEAHHADLFISLHFNSASPVQSAAGLETYCLTPRGMLSSLTRGYEDDPSRAFPNNTFDGQNLQYAVRLHRALLAVNGNQDRGVSRARFMTVLCDQNRPAVLLEAGYLSNPREAEHIADPAYRQKLAEAVARALND